MSLTPISFLAHRGRIRPDRAVIHVGGKIALMEIGDCGYGLMDWICVGFEEEGFDWDNWLNPGEYPYKWMQKTKDGEK